MKQANSLLHEALLIAGIGCWEWNLQKQRLTYTKEVLHIFGLDANTPAKNYRHFLALVHEKDIPLITQAFAQVLQEGKVCRVAFRITRPDGMQYTLEASGQAREDESGKMIKITGTLQDITVRKEAAEAPLTPEQQPYDFIVENIPAMVWTAYPGDKLDYVNTWMQKYTGLPAGKLLGEGWLETVHPDDRQAIKAMQANALRERKPYKTEIRFRRADGSYRWHIRQGLPLTDAEGTVTKWIGINTDIHEQKLKDEALQENEALREAQKKLKAEKEFSENILENNMNGILAFDSHGRITKWNKHMEVLSGKNKEEAIGHTLVELFPGYDKKEEGKAIRQALKGERIRLINYNNPFGLEERFYEITLVPLLVEGEIIGGLGIVYEVTQIIKLEQAQANLQLGQQQEILNAILHAQERERERIAESLHNGIGQLLFAARLNLQRVKPQALEPENQDMLTKVNDLLNEAIRQSRNVSFELVPTILKDFGLETTLEDLALTLSSPALKITVQVEGIESRLEKFMELTIFRIIQTLLSNVIEHAEATRATVYVSKSGNYITIQVTDNGKGFNADTAQATFKGNSLQTASNRVMLLNGRFIIDSGMGKGTTVKITLPVSRQP